MKEIGEKSPIFIMTTEITFEEYKEFRKRSIEASRHYNPNIGTVQIPSIDILRDNGIKLISNPVQIDSSGAILTAVSRLYNGYETIDWSQWSHVLMGVHRQLNGGFEQYIVRGVLKNDFS